jgi:sulfide:quinone oxidoreductase
MDIQALTPTLSVAGQIRASDIPAIANAGFKSVICNRPDGEGADQPGFAEIAQAAQQAGLEVRYLPVETGKVTDAQGSAFGQLLNELPKPVFAYCRSGMRCTTLWRLSNAGGAGQS